MLADLIWVLSVLGALASGADHKFNRVNELLSWRIIHKAKLSCGEGWTFISELSAVVPPAAQYKTRAATEKPIS